MWTAANRRSYERKGLRYPSDMTDAEWALVAAGGCTAARSGPATPSRSSRGVERGLLHSRDGVPVAGAAARPAATLDGARLFHPLAVRPDAGEVASRALRAGPGTGRQGGEPDHRDRRQPERQERGKGGKTPDPVGYDAGKKIKGRKRHAVVDTLGLMLGVAVLSADIQDRDGCLPVLKQVRRLFPFLQRIVADGAYQGTDTACAVRQAAGAPLQIVKRSDIAASSCCRSAESSNAPSVGSTAAGASPKTSNTASDPTSPSSRSP